MKCRAVCGKRSPSHNHNKRICSTKVQWIILSSSMRISRRNRNQSDHSFARNTSHDKIRSPKILELKWTAIKWHSMREKQRWKNCT
jgi:hypothetical protein